MRRSILLLLFVCCLGQLTTELAAQDASLKVGVSNGVVQIDVGDHPFATLDCVNYEKPIIYPLIGPGQIPMTRNHPMKPGVKGEAVDHPHHKSVWFAHGDINKSSYWHGEGQIVFDKMQLSFGKVNKSVTVTVHSKWMDKDDKHACSDSTDYTFSLVPGGRAIDWNVTMIADQGDLMFGDTKEGTMAVRTHPSLRINGNEQVTTANGQAVNSNGTTGKPIWGERAQWVDYSGNVEGKLVGISIFDHPKNLNHPTYWHARDYGLVAANPFGAYKFSNGKDPKGDFLLKKGETLQLRYRIVLHEGNTEQAKVPSLYQSYILGE